MCNVYVGIVPQSSLSLGSNKISRAEISNWFVFYAVSTFLHFYCWRPALPCLAQTPPLSITQQEPVDPPSQVHKLRVERVLFVENILMYFYVGLMNDKVLNRNKIYKQV